MKDHIALKSDKRFRKGHIIKDKNGALRGHPDTIGIKPLEIKAPIFAPDLILNPPMVVDRALGLILKKEAQK